MKKTQNKLTTLTIGLLAVIAASLMIVLALPQARRKAQNWLLNQDRIVVAKLQRELQLADAKSLLTIIKLKRGSDLLVEIYRQEEDSQKMISSFEFKNEFDAQLIQNHGTSNLFLVSRKQDQAFDIVVFGMDHQMNPRTHILEFQEETQEFRLKTPPSEP